MKRDRFIYIAIVSVIVISLCIINIRKYSKLHNLIDISDINIVSYTHSSNGEVDVEIEQSENATYIQFDEKGYIVDNDKLFDILSNYKCRRSRKDYFSYSTYEAEILIEFTLYQNHRPRHFMLGDFNVWYESADKDVYEIFDGNQLALDIQNLITSK